ncbi:hypothetical protein ILUMI_18079, partial [Ignelater luminosus]
ASGWSETTGNDTRYSEVAESETTKSEVDAYSIPDSRDHYDDSDQDTEWTQAKPKNKRTTRFATSPWSTSNEYRTDVRKQTSKPLPTLNLNQPLEPVSNSLSSTASLPPPNTASGSSSEIASKNNKRNVPNRRPHTLCK